MSEVNMKNTILKTFDRTRFEERQTNKYPLGKLTKGLKNYKAFTLAEVLITLVILGLVAAMVIPSTVRRSTETANITKIKKAMATYDRVMSEYYLSGLPSLYANDIKSTRGVLGKNGELDGLEGEAYEAERARLLQERADRKAQIESNYQKNFQNHFNVKTRESDRIFMTSDKLWWDIGTNGNFNTIKVAFKREDLTDKIADSSQNKAFFFIAEKSNVAVTPDTNPTFGVDFSVIRLSDLGGKSSEEIKKIFRMQKLYNYINKKTLNRPADTVCYNQYSSSNCCKNTTEQCIALMPEFNHETDILPITPNTEDEYRYTIYKDGKAVEYRERYNYYPCTYYADRGYICKDKGMFNSKVDAVNKTLTLEKDSGEKKCYNYGGVSESEPCNMLHRDKIDSAMSQFEGTQTYFNAGYTKCWLKVTDCAD